MIVVVRGLTSSSATAKEHGSQITSESCPSHYFFVRRRSCPILAAAYNQNGAMVMQPSVATPAPTIPARSAFFWLDPTELKIIVTATMLITSKHPPMIAVAIRGTLKRFILASRFVCHRRSAGSPGIAYNSFPFLPSRA